VTDYSESSHNWDGTYRKKYWVTGFDFNMRERWETLVYCTGCNMRADAYQYLKKGAEHFENEARQWDYGVSRGRRHSIKMQKGYYRDAGRARLVDRCSLVSDLGWYPKEPGSDE
jgi:hypothetical protein